MPEFSQELWNAAGSIHDRLLRSRDAADLGPLAGEWQALERRARQSRIARRRGWHHCAGRLRDDIHAAALHLGHACDRLIAFLAADRPRPSATVADIYRDLVALGEEFEAAVVADKVDELQVTTDPVELEGVALGRFQICLSLVRLNQASPYRVVALDPHPAECNDQVTHPHVSDETLCEGAGRAAIGAALQAGRLADFFMLVSQILHTYAAGSAFVELRDWSGEPCSGCAASLSADDRSYCQHCDALCCDDCLGCCESCGAGQCHGCLEACAACQQSTCSDCAAPCEKCQATTCVGCISEGRCPQCHESAEEHDHEAKQEERLQPESPIAVQPSGLGQAAVPA